MTGMNKPLKTREMFARELKTSRVNLLVVAVLSVINVLTVLFGAEIYFYFSASVPFFLGLYFAEICGMRSESFYEAYYPEIFGPNWREVVEFSDVSIFYAVIAIALVLSALYFLFWFLSKKSRVGSILALIYYALDLIGHLAFSYFLFGFDGTDLIALLFHAWVIYYLYLGIRAWNGIATAPSELELAAANGVPVGGTPYGSVPYGTVPPTVEGTATPVENAPVEEAPAEEAPAEEAPAEETPAEEEPKAE